MILTTLVDARNFEKQLPLILEAMAGVSFIGLDCETQDSQRHDGFNKFMRVNEEGFKASNTKLIFDHRRTVMTGFSVYPEGSQSAWYVNLNHADVENRLSWEQARRILDAKPAGSFWVAHNATYEVAMFAACYAYPLPDIICTMQLSVTAFGDDNYDLKVFQQSSLLGLEKWPLALFRAAGSPDVVDDDDDEADRRFNREVEDIIGKITAKESDADHSYNGYVKSMAYGHGLKQLVKVFFNHQMGTFKETLGENAHMGQLTGEQTVAYGAEDAFWVIPLFRHLLNYVATHSPNALDTFFSQENPMIQVYAELWLGGMVVNFPNIMSRRAVERMEFAGLLRNLRACLRNFKFKDEPVPELMRREKWYEKNWERYRKLLQDWIDLDNSADDYEECCRVSNAVPNAWREEKGDKGRGPLSITHYMPMRVMLYDLLGGKLQFDMGKVASDGEARGKLKSTMHGEAAQVIEYLAAMAGVEQRMKLYLTPYVLLTDPETQRMYPTVNSLLNSRRMAASTPNPMQLAKRGASTYVRGFFEGDNDDHLVVSLDWSAIELVIIGELSGDPEFKKAFGQLPHDDLHTDATAAVLSVEMPWVTEDVIHSCKRLSTWDDFCDRWGVTPGDAARFMTNLKGEAIPEPLKAHGYWRTEVGKGANFNYWYSGFLTTVGQRMGWGVSTTGNATELYRQKYAVAEEWRVDTIHHGQLHGWIELPDGHRRFRYEATPEWMEWFKVKWPRDEVLDPIVHEIARRIQKRANNQLVNSLVQGTCATIMKRSILRMREKLKELGWDARFMIPIHDEKVYSVHWKLVPEFIRVCREVMISHKDVFPTLALEATPAVGVTFEPWNEKKAPLGQIELFEPPKELGLGADPLDADGIRQVVDYLRAGRRRMAT